jgi:N-acetylmuramoyl-L-alanine amidase-like
MKSDVASHKELIFLGTWTPKKLDTLLQESSKISDAGIWIDYLSKQFLGTPYQESTLIGDINNPEVFVINFKAVDCFTFLDYIESLRRSSSFDEFRENLRKVRYRRGEINFKNRNHFFTDWCEFNSSFIDNVAGQLGGKKVITVMKLLNQKVDGTYFLPGIQHRERLITYIPSNMIDDSIFSQLRTGDYIGIYSETQGLDVSHVGIFIKEENKTYLRHASSLKKYRKVIDQDFSNYMTDKPGILIFRSKK